MKRKAFITGINGQDGSYLSELLLERGYEVYGIIRRSSVAENQTSRIDHIINDINTEYGDMLDCNSLDNLMKTIKPDEVYNLAAQSHVRISFDVPQFTLQVNGLGTLNVLEACRKNAPNARFYQASSSEMFGNNVDENGFQRETTAMNPVSPYGCSKLYAYSIVRNYRHSYKMFAANGILFNHESPRRGNNFVTNKVVKTAVEIYYKKKDKLVLGNMDSYRDWGHSKDYVNAMNMILNHSEPEDFVVATGKTHSVRDLCKYVFGKLGMNYEDYVVQDEKFLRPEELKYLCGDSGKIRSTLGWEPKYNFETLMDDMVDYWVQKENR